MGKEKLEGYKNNLWERIVKEGGKMHFTVQQN